MEDLSYTDDISTSAVLKALEATSETPTDECLALDCETTLKAVLAKIAIVRNNPSSNLKATILRDAALLLGDTMTTLELWSDFS